MFNRNQNIKKLMERQDVQGLIKALKHASEEARTEIIQILADIRDPKATEALLKEAESKDLTLRKLAAQALQKIDPERRYLSAAHIISDTSSKLRVAAIGLMASVGNPKSIETLTNTIKNDRDPAIRAAAAKGIGQIRDRRGAQALVGALTDADKQVRIAAADALAQLGDRSVLPDLMKMHENDPLPEGRTAAENAIAALSRL